MGIRGEKAENPEKRAWARRSGKVKHSHANPAYEAPALVTARACRARMRQRSGPMPFVDTRNLNVIERLPGWYGRYFHSPSMTFAHYDFKRGSSIHEHFHPQKEVYGVIRGELEVTLDGVAQVAR